MTASAPHSGTHPVPLLFPELDDEIVVTRSMLALVPFDEPGWKPHPKSMSLSGLAIHVAQLPNFTTTMALTDVLDFKPEDFAPPPITNTAELLALYDEEVAKMRAALSSLDWARLDGTWKMTMGGHEIVNGKRGYLIRHMGINHSVHHRAQLGVYLRLLGVKLPGSYGPSADTM